MGSRATRPEIKELAKSIKASQTQENAQMRSWYRHWFGGDVPSQTTGGSMGMGMVTSLAALKNAADFDRAFIEQMAQWYRSWYGTP